MSNTIKITANSKADKRTKADLIASILYGLSDREKKIIGLAARQIRLSRPDAQKSKTV